jgi:hypothetical protein
MRRAVAGLVIAMLVLTGCSTLTAGSGAPPTGRWTLPEAQQHYLNFVAPGNQAIAVVNRLICTCIQQLDPQQLASACAAAAADNLALAHNLETGAWPEGVASATDALAAVLRVQARSYQSCASATSLASMRSHEASLVSTAQQADEVRRVLGLSPVGPATMAPRSVVSSPPSSY